MTTQEFQEIFNDRISKCQGTLVTKAAEYSQGGDRLSNFKTSANILQSTPEQACLGFLMKHVTSIVDLIHSIDDGKLAPQMVWDEKIGDAINYLILLEALVRERLRASEPRPA